MLLVPAVSYGQVQLPEELPDEWILTTLPPLPLETDIPYWWMEGQWVNSYSFDPSPDLTDEQFLIHGCYNVLHSLVPAFIGDEYINTEVDPGSWTAP